MVKASSVHRDEGEVVVPRVETSTIADAVPGTAHISSQSYLYLYRKLWNAAALLAGDCLAIMVSLLLACLIRMWWVGTLHVPPWWGLLLIVWAVGAFVAKLLPGWGDSSAESLRRAVLLTAGVYSVFTMMLFLGKQTDTTSRLVVLGAFAITLALLPITRALVRKWLLLVGRWGVPSVIYGDLGGASRLIMALREDAAFGYRAVAVFEGDGGYGGREVLGVPVLGCSQRHVVDAPVAILVGARARTRHAASILDILLMSYSQVLIMPDLGEFPTLWVRAHDLNQGLLVLEVTRNQLDPIAAAFKRGVDLVAVLVTSPIWAAALVGVAFLVWFEDMGNPIFVQERVGKNGVKFGMLKFRTMVPDAERVLGLRMAEDLRLRREWEANYKLRRDPRVTRVGRLLRETSLDELPQIINVLKGDMSLVGPRPLPSYHHEKLAEKVRMLREHLRPGVTGLWQVSGRSELRNGGMERWDAYYVRNWSLWLDITILLRTAAALWTRRGAY